jgi:hypothetical protein
MEHALFPFFGLSPFLRPSKGGEIIPIYSFLIRTNGVSQQVVVRLDFSAPRFQGSPLRFGNLVEGKEVVVFYCYMLFARSCYGLCLFLRFHPPPPPPTFLYLLSIARIPKDLPDINNEATFPPRFYAVPHPDATYGNGRGTGAWVAVNKKPCMPIGRMLEQDVNGNPLPAGQRRDVYGCDQGQVNLVICMIVKGGWGGGALRACS